MVAQGNPGTSVGFVRERFQLSDIALAQLYHGILFEKIFVVMNATPKRFLESEEQKRGDVYPIDTFVTGK